MPAHSSLAAARAIPLGGAMKPAIHVLTGPTAVGKTEWALRWAERNQAEIISCDSLLFIGAWILAPRSPVRPSWRACPII